MSNTPWHNDPGVGDRWLRFNAYLQPATAPTGALRVVAASQHGSTAERISQYLNSQPNLRDRPDALPAVVLETEPGDVIAFDPHLHHGAWGDGARLRWSVDFARNPSDGNADRIEQTRALIAELSSWPAPERWPVWSEWLATSTSPRRAEAIGKLRSLGILS